MQLLNFLQYNNAVPITLGIIFLGASGAYAATNPDVLYSTDQSVVSTDNTYIVNKDLSVFTPRVEIVGVTEDDEKYYVAYQLTSINLVDAVWQDVSEKRVLSVSKNALGEYGDLGIYTTKQLKDIVDREIAYLREVQSIEKRQVSQKVVATTYGGLIGKFLDTTTDTLPGYTPVVTPPITYSEQNTASAISGIAVQNSPLGDTVANQAGTPSAPTLQLLGETPHRIPVGSNFADLGVVATDDSGYMPSVRKFVDGVLVTSDLVTVDTSEPAEFTVRYEATDNEGNVGVLERTIIVYNASAQTTDTAAARPTSEEASTAVDPVVTESATTVPPIMDAPEPETP